MQTKIYHAYIKNGEFFFGAIGVVEHDANISEEDIWDLTNWSCWTNEEDADMIKSSGIAKNGATYYPNEHDRGFTNDDIMFQLDGKWWVAESCGWTQFDTFRKAATYLINHAEWVSNKLDTLK